MQSFLTFYLIVNGLVIFSYFIFRLSERLFSVTRGVPESFRLRLAQLILVTSMGVPLFLRVIPNPSVPLMPLSVKAPLAEIESALDSRLLARRGMPAPREVNSMTGLAAEESMWAMSELRLSHVIFLILVSGFFAVVVMNMFLVRRLLHLLRATTTIRRCGKVRIAISSSSPVPFSTRVGGWVWVVLPDRLLTHWSDFKLAVLHELQHHRQKDTLWAIAIEFLAGIMYVNPVIYAWKRRILEIQEFSCDEALIGRKTPSYDYGSCLVRVAEAAIGQRSLLVGTASMAAASEDPTYFKSFLRRRIEMLRQHSTRKPNRLMGYTVGTITLLVTAAAAYAAQQASSGGKNIAIGDGTVATEPAIQRIADSALTGAMKKFGASLGFVVVSDPMTGRVLAVANQDRVAEKNVARTAHWALSLQVEPGSISKAIIAAAALEKGVTTVDEMHNCENGAYSFGSRVYHDWKAFNKLSTMDTIVHSSNVCGIKIAQKLGAGQLFQTFKDFGFGPNGSADGFPEARAGDLLDPGQVDSSLYVANVSTGYDGVFPSPIELVQAVGAIANGGKLLKPLATSSGRPQVVQRVLSEQTSAKMKEILAQVMVRGTAHKSKSDLYRLAGKTSTAYSRTHVGHDSLGGGANMAGFIGFGPVEKPRIVVYVGIENPTDGNGVHGSAHAAPVFKEVAEKTLSYLKVPHDASSN